MIIWMMILTTSITTKGTLAFDTLNHRVDKYLT